MDKDFYSLHAKICKTIASAKRLEIVDTLRHGPMTVGSLAEKTGMSQANLSQHLAVLRGAGMVRADRRGLMMYYSLANPKIAAAFDLISEILKETSASENQTIYEAMTVK